MRYTFQSKLQNVAELAFNLLAMSLRFNTRLDMQNTIYGRPA